MHAKGRKHRMWRRGGAAAAVLAGVVAVAGCGPGKGTADGGGARVDSGVGRTSVAADQVDLRITGAVARLDARGDGELAMDVDNRGDAPEHLVAVAEPGGGQAELRGGRGAGIPIAAGDAVRVGTHGTSVRLHGIPHAASRGTVPLTLLFGVARGVTLTARVTHAG